MYEAALFLMDGFEEIEAVTPLDILRRSGIDVVSVSLTDELEVVGAHGICIEADLMFDELKNVENTTLILPGGPGVVNYKGHEGLHEMLIKHNNRGGRIAAICAAPTVLGSLGILKDKRAVCHPSKENELNAKEIVWQSVVTDGNITTSLAAGTSMAFAVELVKLLKGEAAADEVTRHAFLKVE